MHRLTVLLIAICLGFCIQQAPAQSLEWQPLNESPYEERMFHVISGTTPGSWYIANSYYGLWGTEDDGRHWNRLMNEFAPNIQDIAVHPNNEKHLYVASGSWGLWWSTNGGQSWLNETFVLHGQGSRVGAVAISPVNPSLVFAGNARTTNNFQSWNTMGDINAGILQDYKFLSDGTAFASENFGILTVKKSTDNGQSWSTAGVFTSNGLARMVVDSNDHVYVAAHLGSATPAVFKSADKGATWNPTPLPTIDTNSTIVRDLAYHKGSHTLYALVSDAFAVHPGYIYKSLDGGKNWTEVKRPDLNLALSGIAVSEDQKLMLSSNSYDHSVQLLENNKWKERSGNLTSDLIADLIYYKPSSIAVQGAEFVAISEGGGVYRSREKGDSLWERKSGFVHGRKSVFHVSEDPLNSDLLVASVAGAYRSDDFGETWELLTANLVDTNSNVLVSRIFADTLGNYYTCLQHNATLFNNLGQSLFISTDQGASWDTLLLVSGFTGAINHFLVDAGGNVFTNSGWRMLRSKDQGASWDTINNNLPTLVTEYVLDRNGRLFYMYEGWLELEIYYSNDLGDTWTKAGGYTPDPGYHTQTARIYFDNNNDLWLTHNLDSSIFYSPDLGQSWQTKAKGFPYGFEENWMKGLAFDDENTPYGFDIWGQMYKYTEKEDTPTGVQMPGEFQLSVYPNPAGNVLNIELPEEIHGMKSEILIADITGRIVLSDVQMPTETLTLDVRTFSAGSYLLVVRVDGRKWFAKWTKPE